MREEPRNNIKISDSNNISITNISYGYLLREYVRIIFSRFLPYSRGIVISLNHPTKSSAELTDTLYTKKNCFNRSEINKPNRDHNLPESCKLSLLCDNHSQSGHNQIIDFLALSWVTYDFSEIYFLPDEESIKNQEDIIFNSKKISMIDEKNLTSYACCFKDHSDDYIFSLYNESNISLISILTPDPTIYINASISDGILYQIPYTNRVVKNRSSIDSVLHQFGLKNILNNPDFEIDESSTIDQQIINIKKKESVFVQIQIKENEINFNIDRVSFAISVKPKNTDHLLKTMRLILFSKIKVKYTGYYQTKIYFSDQNDVVLNVISRSFIPILSLFSKKEVFTYQPIYK